MVVIGGHKRGCRWRVLPELNVETETESRSDMKSLSRITSMRLAAKIAAMAGVRPGAAPLNVLGGQGLDLDAFGREAA